jgi:hypothetical protein
MVQELFRGGETPLGQPIEQRQFRMPEPGGDEAAAGFGRKCQQVCEQAWHQAPRQRLAVVAAGPEPGGIVMGIESTQKARCVRGEAGRIYHRGAGRGCHARDLSVHPGTNRVF